MKKETMGVINQILDLAETPVEKRQEINDICTNYLQNFLDNQWEIRYLKFIEESMGSILSEEQLTEVKELATKKLYQYGQTISQ